MDRPYGLTLRLWVEAVCPYLSLKEVQAFRLCSKGCRSLIHQALPFCLEVHIAILAQLQANPMLQEEDQYKASETQRLAGVFQSAQTGLNSLTKADIDSLKRMKSAPAPILETGKIVNLLLGYPKADNPFSHWGMDHLNRLMTFDRSNISHREIQTLGRFLQDYSEEAVSAAGKSCVGMYHFLRAIWLLSSPAPARPAGIREEIESVSKTIEVFRRLAEK